MYIVRLMHGIGKLVGFWGEVGSFWGESSPLHLPVDETLPKSVGSLQKSSASIKVDKKDL